MNDIVSSGTAATSAREPSQARERILTAAYELFAHRGIRAVSIEDILAEAAVSKSTLYKHFPTKEALALAFLGRREQLWTLDFVKDGALRRGSTPTQRLLAIFDVFDDWFHEGAYLDFEGCSFINTLVEMGAGDPLGRAAIDCLANIRTVVITDLATEAGLRDPDEFARSWHILMKGSIISAGEGDPHAAKRAQAMARRLIEDYTPVAG